MYAIFSLSSDRVSVLTVLEDDSLTKDGRRDTESEALSDSVNAVSYTHLYFDYVLN